MRKLTKIINKRRKNYKPTIGVEFGHGKRISANLYEWKKYLQELEERKEAAAEAEARKLIVDFINQNPTLRQHMNRITSFMAAIGGALGGVLYY